jgi:hypothetical protein
MADSRYGILVTYPIYNQAQHVFDGGATLDEAKTAAYKLMTKEPSIVSVVVYPLAFVEDETYVLTRENQKQAGHSGWQRASEAYGTIGGGKTR